MKWSERSKAYRVACYIGYAIAFVLWVFMIYASWDDKLTRILSILFPLILLIAIISVPLLLTLVIEIFVGYSLIVNRDVSDIYFWWNFALYIAICLYADGIVGRYGLLGIKILSGK